MIADPRDAQIDRLKQQVGQLTDRLAAEQRTVELAAFRTQALSRLASQHEEIRRLRAAVSDASNVRNLARSVHAPHLDRNLPLDGASRRPLSRFLLNGRR